MFTGKIQASMGVSAEVVLVLVLTANIHRRHPRPVHLRIIREHQACCQSLFVKHGFFLMTRDYLSRPSKSTFSTFENQLSTSCFRRLQSETTAWTGNSSGWNHWRMQPAFLHSFTVTALTGHPWPPLLHLLIPLSLHASPHPENEVMKPSKKEWTHWAKTVLCFIGRFILKHVDHNEGIWWTENETWCH